MSSHCNISHPCFFTQLNLLIHFASKPICLSSRSQTVPCPHCSLFSCPVYFSLSLRCFTFSEQQSRFQSFCPLGDRGHLSPHLCPSSSSFLQSLPPHLPRSLLSSLLSNCLDVREPDLTCASFKGSSVFTDSPPRL